MRLRVGLVFGLRKITADAGMGGLGVAWSWCTARLSDIT